MKILGSIVLTLGIVLLIGLILFAGIRWYQFKLNCKDYLKLAGDAPTIQKADEFLGRAISYLEDHNLIRGNSAILFRTPSCDVGIWYGQIKGAKETLTRIISKGDESSQLEKDNALMKIREVVLDEGEKGTKVTTPKNITLFPLQSLFTFMNLFALSLLIIGGIILFRHLND